MCWKQPGGWPMASLGGPRKKHLCHTRKTTAAKSCHVVLMFSATSHMSATFSTLTSPPSASGTCWRRAWERGEGVKLPNSFQSLTCCADFKILKHSKTDKACAMWKAKQQFSIIILSAFATWLVLWNEGSFATTLPCVFGNSEFQVHLVAFLLGFRTMLERFPICQFAKFFPLALVLLCAAAVSSDEMMQWPFLFPDSLISNLSIW